MKTVKVVQHVHPNGRKREMEVELPDEVADMADGQVLTCECMPNDYTKVVLYSYPKGTDPDKHPEAERIEIASNGLGPKSPITVLEGLIRRVDREEKDAVQAIAKKEGSREKDHTS